jgi:transcriptional regulator with XRE-family HTH domain
MARRKVRIEQAEVVRRFAGRLREVRLARGMTQVQLADRASVTPTYIGKLEGGRVAPGIDLVDRLSRALGTTLADLLPESAPPDPVAVLREQAARLSEALKGSDRETLLLVIPLLARLLESPTRRR